MSKFQNLVYRGGSLKRLNKSELSRGYIRGNKVDLYYFEDVENLWKYDTAFIKVSNIPKELPTSFKQKVSRVATGGLSENIGTGIYYANLFESFGLTLIMEKNLISQHLERAYEKETLRRYPETFAQIPTSPVDFVVLIGDCIIGGGRYEKAEVPSNRKLPEDEISVTPSDTYLNPTYQVEDELISPSGRINISQSIVGIGSYVGLEDRDMVRILSSFAQYKEERLKRYTPEKKSELMFKEVRKRMRDYSQLLSVIVVSTVYGIDRADNKLPRSLFNFLYNGRNFIYEYENLGIFR